MIFQLTILSFTKYMASVMSVVVNANVNVSLDLNVSLDVNVNVNVGWATICACAVSREGHEREREWPSAASVLHTQETTVLSGNTNLLLSSWLMEINIQQIGNWGQMSSFKEMIYWW